MALRFPSPQTLIAALALASSPDCAVNGDSLQCRLLSFLNILYILGAVLAVILLVVLAFAVRTWIATRNDKDLPTKPSTSKKAPRV